MEIFTGKSDMRNKCVVILAFLNLCVILAVSTNSRANTESLTPKEANKANTVALEASNVVEVIVDATDSGKPLRHIWQYFGYDECNYTTTPHAKKLMSTLADINPEQVSRRRRV